MNHLVKIIFDDDGAKIDSPKWHLVINQTDSNMTLCKSEVFGLGEGNAIFKEKQKEKGGITCNDCINKIKFFKSIKL